MSERSFFAPHTLEFLEVKPFYLKSFVYVVWEMEVQFEQDKLSEIQKSSFLTCALSS